MDEPGPGLGQEKLRLNQIPGTQGYRALKENDPESDESEQHNKSRNENKATLFGCVLAFAYVILMCFKMSLIQTLDQSIPMTELNGFQYLSQLVIALPFLAYDRKCDVTVDKKMTCWLFLLALTMTSTTFCAFVWASVLPLGIGSGLSRSLELFGNAVLRCVLYKTVRASECVAVILCVIGTLMVTQPALLFPNAVPREPTVNHTHVIHCGKNIHSTENTTDSFYNILGNDTLVAMEISHNKIGTSVGYLACVGNALGDIIYMNILNYKLNDISSFVYSFWVSLYGILFYFTAMGIFSEPTFPSSTPCAMVLILEIIIAGSVYNITLKYCQILPPVVGSIIRALLIPLTFMLQYTLLSGLHPDHANILGIIGAVFVCLGNFIIPSLLLRTYLNEHN